MRDVERLCPFQPPLGEHFELRRKQFRMVQAAKHDEDGAREAVQIAGEQSGAALWTEVAVEPLVGFGDVVKRFRVTAGQGEVILRHAEERGHLPARRFFTI